MEITERIFALLEAQGKKQSDFARSIGVRTATISDWKRKRATPASERLADIAAYLGVSIDYLCTGKEYAAASVKQNIVGDGNHHNGVNIGGAAGTLSEFEQELLRVYAALDARGKNALLSFAYDLEKKIEDK